MEQSATQTRIASFSQSLDMTEMERTNIEDNFQDLFFKEKEKARYNQRAQTYSIITHFHSVLRRFVFLWP